MDQLIFATNNQHKIDEINHALGNLIKIITLKDAGIDVDIPEPYDTLEENARIKSFTIYQLTGKNCFSEDTGLEVERLQGEPGVKSARYAGNENSSSANIEKLLKKMEGVEERCAQFRTIVSLIIDEKEAQFEGICRGRIVKEQRGQSGFGYDPVFIPDGSEQTFAEMDIQGKNRFSHRKKAVDKLIKFLEFTHKIN